MFEGFGGRKPRPSDDDLRKVDEAIALLSQQAAEPAAAAGAEPVAWIPLGTVRKIAHLPSSASNLPIFTKENSTEDERRRYHESCYDLTPVFATPPAEAQAAPVDHPCVSKDVLEDAKNTILWLLRRLSKGYGEPPHVSRTIAALEKSIATLSQQSAVRVPEELREIGRLLATQDNRCTDQPLFVVQQKRAYVTEDGYNDCYYEWRETTSGDYSIASPQKRVHLEKYFAEHGCAPDGWMRFAMFDTWEFVTACFTEQGCKEYLRINGHNLNEPRIYADGSFRNHEYRAVRNWLLSIAAAPTQADSSNQDGGN